MSNAGTKICLVCHGNIARSQILHHYLAEYANRAALTVDLFSCGTAPRDAYPDAARLLAEVQSELKRRGLKALVKRDILGEATLQYLAGADLILVADHKRRSEVLARLGDRAEPKKVLLFYEFIGEGQKDFVDTYDAGKGAQDPQRFARCFDELERIAKLTVAKLQRNEPTLNPPDPSSRRPTPGTAG